MNSAYQCNICVKMLSTENALNDHKASQQGEGDNFSYNCPECPYTVHKANLKRHLKTAHKYPEKRIKLDQWRQEAHHQEEEEDGQELEHQGIVRVDRR